MSVFLYAAKQGTLFDVSIPSFLQDEQLLTLPEAAEKMGLVVTKVIRMVKDHHLLAVSDQGVKKIPARYLNDDGELIKFVPGVIALLADGGYQDAEILRYLFTEDESLPGRPIDALHGHLAREVMRRAQAMAF